ncbi:hypothetical protein SY83_08245 [Paenibacillus swuensis]|uniref:N-acetyltransferase domain-containing protein n=1 Tax=Paenibacillus swuensis TaxID=1178515 RepID=A0A172TH98_9BACL|nr:GNAT family N-acetyltransferase [Paenibacillus swuensis]ANE46264.1 hypothetical protein SY83_08245 [Paenibacillus swuensis]
MKIVTYSLHKQDAKYIPAWTEQWMSMVQPSVFHLTKFSCPGYVAYTTDLLENSSSGACFMGAYEGTRLTGFIEYFMNEDGLFINNFAVSQQDRGKGIGGRLLSDTFDIAREQGVSQVQLDCFVWNDNALNLYKALGFQIRTNAYWHMIESPVADRDARQVNGFRAWDMYDGLSQITMDTDSGQVHMACLHRKYLRVITGGSGNLLQDHQLEEIVTVFPHCSLLIITPEPEWKCIFKAGLISTNVRMHKCL